MIARYTPADFADLWTSDTRFKVWLEVELAACEAMEHAGLVPEGVAARLRSMNLVLDANRIETIERTVKHDVIAFLTHVEELAGQDARWLHRGMTSSDVLDSALAILMVQAVDKLLVRSDAALEALAKRAREHAETPMIGRSHGMFAEPVTFGIVLAGHFAEMKRGRDRLVRAREAIAYGKIAGAVGTYAHISPEIEAEALGKLGLKAEPLATQVVPRDRHAEVFMACALLAAAIERLATNVRHWQRSDVGEAEESFTAGQKGSSAMPHKRNPILSENLCGLARVVRAAVTPALENIVLWHERDISHSSMERMMIPDVTATLAFMLDRTKTLVDGLAVYPENMQRSLDRAGDLFFSEGLLLALVESGMARQEAYVFVQRNAMKAWRGEGTLRTNVLADEDVTERLSSERIATCFDIAHVLRFAKVMVERALAS